MSCVQSVYSFICVLTCEVTRVVLSGRGYNGMLACFFHGLLCVLLAKTSRSLQILMRVDDGWMMSSTNPADVESVLMCVVVFCVHLF